MSTNIDSPELAKRDIGMRPPLPKGWVWTHLSAIAELKGGITKGQKRKSQDILSSVPYLRVANVQRGYLDLTEIKQIEATEDEIKELRLLPGDILFNEGGDRDKLGRGWVWRGEISECIHQNHVFRARLYMSELQPKLISWYGNSFGQRYFISEGKQTTNLASINLTKLGALPIPLPPINEQHRIVAEIETQFTRLDAVVTAFKRVQANLKRYRASVLQAACTGRLVPTEAEIARAEGRAYESADELLQRILQERRAKWESEQLIAMKAAGKAPKDDRWKSKYREPAKPDTRELLGLPEGWMWASLDQLLSLLRNGISKKPDELTGLPILRISSVRPMSVDFHDIRFLAGNPGDYLDYVLEPGDLLFTRYNGTRSLVGVCAVVPTITEKFVHPDKIIRCKAVSPEASIPGYLEIVLNTGSSRGFLEKRIRTTAGQSGVSGSDLRQIPVPLPPVNEQHRIIAEVERRLSVIDALEAIIATNLKRADRLRQAILKRAFKGKLVPQDPTDEHARVLLERIRMERDHTTEKPKAIPRQTHAPQPIVQPKAITPVQGELALEFRQ